MQQSVSFTLIALVESLAQSGISLELSRRGRAVALTEQQQFNGLGTLQSASPSQISFLANSQYAPLLETCEAGAIFVKPGFESSCRQLALTTEHPYLAYAKTSQFIQNLVGDVLDVESGIDVTAVVHASAVIGRGVSIGPGVVIGANAHLGHDVHIGAYSVIGAHVSIGAATKIAAHVVLYADTQLGQRCRIQANTTIGADGFGYAPTAAGWQPIAQLGGVVIGDDVHIGANTSVDRGAITPTQIHQGVIIDNQVQIAHNVVIGEHSAIAGCVGIAGSTQIGAHCTVAGAAGLAGHLTICDKVHIGMQAQVTKSIDEPGRYGSGTGLYPLAKWRRLVGRLRRLL